MNVTDLFSSKWEKAEGEAADAALIWQQLSPDGLG